jgi:hypothetical protein
VILERRVGRRESGVRRRQRGVGSGERGEVRGDEASACSPIKLKALNSLW